MTRTAKFTEIWKSLFSTWILTHSFHEFIKIFAADHLVFTAQCFCHFLFLDEKMSAVSRINWSQGESLNRKGGFYFKILSAWLTHWQLTGPAKKKRASLENGQILRHSLLMRMRYPAFSTSWQDFWEEHREKIYVIVAIIIVYNWISVNLYWIYFAVWNINYITENISQNIKNILESSLIQENFSQILKWFEIVSIDLRSNK